MRRSSLEHWFDLQVEMHAFSGVALVRRGGETLFSYAGGLAQRAHRVPVRSDTRFAVASVGKLATGIAALRLVDRGVLRLDQPVLDVLPAEHRTLALTRVHTLHHLLSHTSGLPDYHDEDDDASFVACWDRIPTYHARRPSDLLPLFAGLPALEPAGSTYRYNDAGFVLAGLVLEAAAGLPYGQLMHDEVFGPAGLTDTAIDALDADPDRLALGYLMDDGPAERWRTNVFSVTANAMPDGGMITSAPDLAQLVDALFEGRLLSPALVRAMTTPQSAALPDAPNACYGYGCELGIADGRVVVVGHGGSDPGVSARVSHFLDAATTIVVLCNQDRGSWTATVQLTQAFGIAEPRA